MVDISNAAVAVQSVRGVLSFFLAIGLWKLIESVEKIFGKKPAMWTAVVISCLAFLLLEEFPRATP